MIPARSLRLSFLALILLFSCGPEELEASVRDGALRLELAPETEVTTDRGPVQVLTLSGSELRSIEAGPGTEVRLNGEYLQVSGRRLVVRDLPERFDRVSLRLRSQGKRMECRLLSADGTPVVDLPRTVAIPKGRDKPGALTFRTEMALPHAGRIDRMELQIFGGEPVTEIHELVFVETPVEAWFPPAGTTDLVTVGYDARVGVGLSQASAMTTEVPAGDGERRLSFALGTPPFLGMDAPVEVTVTFTQDGRAETFRVPTGEWREETVHVPEGEQQVRFELRGPELAICGLSRPVLEAAEPDPRTVLLITSDTHRGDHLSLFDRDIVETPFLDRLAQGGYFFEDCQAACNVTNPSHFSVFSGLPVRDHAVIGNNLRPSASIPTLGEAYAAAGFHTFAALSASHLIWSGCERGFDRVHSPRLGEFDSSETIRVLEEWLDGSKDRSLFVWLHSFDPHDPYLPPEDLLAKYWNEGSADGAPEGAVPAWTQKLGVTDVREVAALYKGEVTYWDEQLEGLMNRRPRLMDGVIAFVGDHGETLLHPSFERRFTHHGLSRDTLHVPLILRFPGGESGTRVARPVAQEDVGRTLLDLSGLTHMAFPGSNLLGQAEKTGDVLRFAIEVNGRNACVSRGKWMLIQGLYSEGKPPVAAHSVGLYDVTSDPACLVDLAGEHEKLARELRTALVHWLEGHRVGRYGDGSAIQDAKSIANLAALGYSEASAVSGENPWIDSGCDCESCREFPILSH